jgi:hypothetical protein
MPTMAGGKEQEVVPATLKSLWSLVDGAVFVFCQPRAMLASQPGFSRHCTRAAKAPHL